ncbi:unnamed protein product [Clavelina lepadiformis]|uniref:Protein Hikeshi n=1 Tax=Clavelina lepadiformis TaxID=159417 RepID=A0ABP0FJF3_CLALP
MPYGPGRLVQTDATQVNERKFLFTLMDMDNVNHIVVFMTGQAAFPDGLGAAVYINWPSSSGETSWQLIGHLTNQKPSAIFKISGMIKDQNSASNVFSDMASHPHHAQLGISLEPLAELAQQVPVTSVNPSEQAATFEEFVNNMLMSFYNYSTSFSKSLAEIASIASTMDGSVGQTQFLPLSVLENWQKLFQAKLSRDVNFWKK